MTDLLRTLSRDKKYRKQSDFPLPFFCPDCQRVSELKPSQAGRKHRCPFCGERSRAVIPQCPWEDMPMQDKPKICDLCREMTPYGFIYHFQKICRINREMTLTAPPDGENTGGRRRKTRERDCSADAGASAKNAF